MSNESIPSELQIISDDLKKQASQIDNLVGLILIMLVLWLYSEFYNGIGYAKTNLVLFTLGDTFTQKAQTFENGTETILSDQSFNGTYEISVQTWDGQEFYWYTNRFGNQIYPIVKIVVQADRADYGFDVRITKIDIYPENNTLRDKLESGTTVYLEPFSGIVQDVSRQIMRQQEFSPPDISLFGFNAPSKWFPILIALISFMCSQIINSYSLKLAEFIHERKRHEYKGTRRAFLDRITGLLMPSLFIQSYQNKRWYPFSSFMIWVMGMVYVLLNVVTIPRVNFYREANNLPVVLDLSQNHLLNALLIIGSLLIIKNSLDKLNIKIIASNKKRNA